jgi:inner membrane protein
MDTLTHVALGACIGEVFFEKGFGKKAMWWGAMAQSIADIDFIAFLWMDTPSALLAHRGFTHSILFLLLMAPAFALLAEKVHRPHNIRFVQWLFFFQIEMAAHILLDLCNNYGMGIFEPFIHDRYAFNLLYVADPLFSLMPGLAFVMLIIKNRYDLKRLIWVRWTFYAVTIYIVAATLIKINTENAVKSEIKFNNWIIKDKISTPAPFQIFLWYQVLQTKNGYWVSYRSVFDQSKTQTWNFHPRAERLLDNVADHENLQRLIRFSGGYYQANIMHDSLFFSDLRFGQVLGWHYPNNPFVFHYLLSHPIDQKLVVQRGRLQSWNLSELKIYLKRVLGKTDFR